MRCSHRSRPAPELHRTQEFVEARPLRQRPNWLEIWVCLDHRKADDDSLEWVAMAHLPQCAASRQVDEFVRGMKSVSRQPDQNRDNRTR
jgi:hypothetical protein